ncbi:Co2+/Mg2+ efflux protein ApaG [Chelatococcus sambhunathii]|uniref:Protein ApaG n=1 Tax=Chelatococcus sambhunathii TaxID=363953 RepID=A0ABU1DKV2_9HYPH|nr:Co2+/Mg2+ efflux protein ApaG [Chelatococcus sambhunathii]MDR4308759.1 Co2+/Mg2+ efflux protein ApaG [Chelatococcus sambhunathii]
MTHTSATDAEDAHCWTAITRAIRVTVTPRYLPNESEPDENRYVFAYTVEIVNEGQETVRLIARHWRITDARGRTEEVRGPGVVGEQPTLQPGQSFTYTSGAPIGTPSGIMVGDYHMMTDAGQPFDVAIPAFALESPHAIRTLH